MSNLSPATPDAIDLRSDTVTRPSLEMYEAMRTAVLGDDVLGDDPTVIELERLGAATVGKEAALFVPSGTMGNQIALAAQCQPGDAILVEEEAHILYYEVGASALLAGVVNWTLPSQRGTIDPQVLEKRVLKADPLHTPGTTLFALENTHNRAGGAVVGLDAMQAYGDIAKRHGMKFHLDGARLFNAAVALGVPASEVCKPVDTVTFCLSKGLRSPIGSLLCGSTEFVDRARRWRKRLGGGMRQAGILAACGIVSLTKMVDRLVDDHARAKRLATALQNVAGVTVDLSGVETNMVLVNTQEPAARWQQELGRYGLHCFPVGSNRLRLVFHADVTDEMTDRAIEIFQKSTDSLHA